jgi:hypothetical protein
MAGARHVEPADPHAAPLGPQRVGVGLARVGVALAVAVRDQHRAAVELLHRVRGVQPRSQRADRDHVRRPGGAQRGSAPHRVPDQHHRPVGEASVQLVEGPLGVAQRVPVRAVPAAVAVAEQEDRRPGPAASGQHPGDRHHPQVGQPRAVAGLVAARPPTVQHQDDRVRRGGRAADRFEAGQGIVGHRANLTGGRRRRRAGVRAEPGPRTAHGT